MRYFFCCILLFIQFFQAFSQNTQSDKWSLYITGIGSEIKASPFYLIKYSDLSDKRTFIIMKRLDEDFAIVKFLKSADLKKARQNSLVQPVNNLWKESASIKLVPSSSKGQYLIRSICDLELTSKSKLKVNKLFQGSPTYLIEGKLADIKEEFLENDCVIYIGKESLTPHSEASVNDLNLTFNKISSVHNLFPDLNGEKIIVSVKENLYNLNDLDLMGKDIPSGINSETVENHATEMATVIGGKGVSFVTGRGVAKNVSLSSSDFKDIVPDTDQEYKDLDIDLQNHSYGTVIENFYGTLAESYDASNFNNPTILHTFSAGNIGFQTSTEGAYKDVPNFANLTGNFKSAKNNLIVGSVDDTGSVLAFSSRGPTFDGRVKPEIVTYSLIGTSNSAAMVTGLSTLIYQLYEEKYQEKPTSALVKSLLINSATDVENEGIDFKTGYGNVNGIRAISNLNNNFFKLDSLSDSDSSIFNLNIPANAINLKVTLVWTDSASIPTSTKSLINDLDLSVITLAGDTILPWVLNSSRANLDDLPIRTEDHLNNVEQITLDTLNAGVYQIKVKAFDVVSPQQKYALSYQYDIAENFGWSYPLVNDNIPYDGESTPYLQWENSYPAETTGNLAYSIDNGISWETISESLDVSRGSYKWEDYPKIYGIAELRMTINGEVFKSPQFTISYPERINLGFDCGDSILFFWNKNENVLSYDFLNLSGEQLDVFKSTSDTSILVNKSELDQTFIALQPLFSGGKKPIRSFTIDYELQGGACYFTSIFPQLIPEEEKVLIITSIGTTFNIESIVYERLNNGVFEEIGQGEPSSLELEFTDENPLQGINVYRAVAVLKSGQRIISDETDIHFLTTIPVQIFPNPIEKPNSFSVFTKDFGEEKLTIEIYTLQGSLVFTDVINTDRESISTSQFTEGIYMYVIESSSFKKVGRIIIN